MILDEITFPIYVIGTDNIEHRDGVVFADAKVVDDTNMKGSTIGIRRLQTELPHLYDLRYMNNEVNVQKSRNAYKKKKSRNKLKSHAPKMLTAF